MKLNTTLVKEYEKRNLLSKFGFDNWIGPEPHGIDKHNSRMIRDKDYLQQALDIINKMQNSSDHENPFLLIVNFVNPHDIVFYPTLAFNFFSDPWYIAKNLPYSVELPTLYESLNNKPSVQQGYKKLYNRVFGTHFLWCHITEHTTII